MPKQNTLGKNERVKSRKQIEQLFSEGKKFVAGPFRTFYLFSGQSELQFGVGVSAKNFKKAVDRNRIKRLIKEAWRLQKNELKEKLISENKKYVVFIIYTAKELPDYKLVSDKIKVVIQKLINTIE